MLEFGEKRRYPRIDIRIPLQYKELHTPTPSIKGALTNDLSEGGVKFKSDKFISLACRMVVEISLPNEFKPIKAISKVAWIKKLPIGDDYEIGNQFLDMTKDDKRVINDYVKTRAETGSV